ncbi:MAG: CCA tRNA nucleotidyltransferase [Clostridium sp.]
MEFKIELPKSVKFIIDKFKENGFESYAVGGCVRDSLINRKVNDWDITTNAKPEDTINIFEKTVPTGIKHGTVTVILDKENFEVTTYRIDGKYKDGRHPEKVQFVSELKEDLSRRDFTINAMAYNEEKGLIDYFKGKEDLNKKIIKAVGNPDKRFEEDALRMLRAIRFAAQLNFFIEPSTKEGIKNLSGNIKNVSIERIRVEFDKIIVSNPMYINELIDLGLLKHFLKELCLCKGVEQQNPHHVYDVLTHILKATENIESKLYLRLTMVLHDICKPECKRVDEKGIGHFYGHDLASADKAFEILKRMKYDNETINKVVTLIKYHDRDIRSKKSIRKLLSLIGEDLFRDLLKVKKADALAQNPKFYKEKEEKLIETEKKLNEIIKAQECFTIKNLDVDGKDLIALGIKPGKDIGIILNNLLNKVIENPNLNKKEILINMIKNLK